MLAVCARTVVLRLCCCVLCVYTHKHRYVKRFIMPVLPPFLLCFLVLFVGFLGANQVCIYWFHLVCRWLVGCLGFCCSGLFFWVLFCNFMLVYLFVCVLCSVRTFCVLASPPKSFLRPQYPCNFVIHTCPSIIFYAVPPSPFFAVHVLCFSSAL